MIRWMIAVLALAWGTPVLAVDTKPCGADLVCASRPDTVIEAIRNAGYRAKDRDEKGKPLADGGGDPMLASSAAGYDYDVFFYGCKENKQCDALQFHIAYSKDAANTAALANKWNDKMRFGSASIDEKGRFVVEYDVTTAGGLTQANFADVIDWWATTLGNLSKFFAENPAPKT